MKRWLIVGWLLLPAVLCAQERVTAGSESEPEPEPEPRARVIAHPQEVPALATYEQGQPLTPDASSTALPVEPSSPSSVLASEPLKALPGRTRYAFDQPEILLRQRLFGLAHGVSLLAAACVALPEQSAATQTSFVAWHDQQAIAIEQVVRELAAYYFGPQGGAAQWKDLTRVLKLKEYIDQSLGQFELSVACASLNQAISGPRYDLAVLLQMDPLIAMKIIEGEFVPVSVPVGATDSSTPAPPPLVKDAISALPTEEKMPPDEPAKPHAP